MTANADVYTFRTNLPNVISSNSLMGTLKRQRNGPSYSNTVIGTLPSWVGCYIWYSEKGPGWAAAPPSSLLAVPNVTAHTSTASVPVS